MSSEEEYSDLEFDSHGVVELGLPDRTVHEYDRMDPFVSRLGGEPTWLTTPPPDSELLCPVCSSKMFLLFQFDCPEESESVDRVLYLFACNTKKCVYSAPNKVFKAVLQKRPVESKKEVKTVSAVNFWDSSETVDSKADTVKQTDFVSCGKSKGLPVTVLKIVEELIRPKRTNQSENQNFSVENKTDQDGSSEEETVKEDIVMDAFLDRISHYPRQCIRYSPNGRPLHFSESHSNSYSKITCYKCSQPNPSFLAQLMPAFLSMVPVDEHVEHIPKAERGKFAPFGDGIEFATVLVLVCEGCESAFVHVELEEYHQH